MGRIFETRKHTMFARWDRMAKTFSRIGKEIAIAVRAGGPSAENNPALRRAIQNARAANMPKDRIENAIKKASGQGAESYEEILYEGYGPHGVPIIVETATDNLTRTVANLRVHFNKTGGNLANTGSVSFLFDRVGVFKIKAEGVDRDEVELELIDHGLEALSTGTTDKGEAVLVLKCAFTAFGQLQKAIEDLALETVSAEPEWEPRTVTELPEAETDEVLELIDRLEQDDDVQRVFHNLA